MKISVEQPRGEGGPARRIESTVDRDTVAELLGTSLLTPGTSLEGIEPIYARVKGSDGNLVAYEARIRTPNGVVARTVSVRSGPIGRLVSQAGRFRDPRGASWTAPLRPCFLDRKRGLLLIASPLDRALPDLRRVLKTKWVRRTLSAAGILADHSGRMRRRRSTLTLMSYRPERRAVVRLDARFVGERQGRTLFLRLHADPAFAEASEHALRALSEVGGPVPVHLGRPLPHLAVESGCVGEPLDGRTLCRSELARSVGRVLARVHSSAVPGGMTVRENAEVAESGLACAARLAEIHPELGRRAVALATELTTVRPDTVTPRLLHGDLHPAQFLVDGESVVLIDWDRSHAGHPASDLGTLRARLALEAGSDGILAFSEILSAYGEVAPAPSREAIHWHEAHALLRLLDSPFRRLAEDWVAHTNRIIERLEEAACSVSD